MGPLAALVFIFQNAARLLLVGRHRCCCLFVRAACGLKAAYGLKLPEVWWRARVITRRLLDGVTGRRSPKRLTSES